MAMHKEDREDSELIETEYPISMGEYAEFIRQIELARIWLISSHLENRHGPDTPESVRVGISSTERWEDRDGGFFAEVSYDAQFVHDEQKLAGVKVSFGLLYDSLLPMRESIFGLFAENNLPLNTWPYFREYLASTVSRMGWLAFTLPSLKIGTGREEDN